MSDNILDAESRALIVSKRVVRELFEQKLQRELDRLEEVSTLLSTAAAFGMAGNLLEQVCGVEISTKGVQEISDRRGGELLNILQAEAQTQRPFDDTGLPRVPAVRPSGTCPIGSAPRRAYIEIDGVIPMTRVEVDASKLSDIDRARQARAKANKVRGGKGKRFTIVGREVKNAVLYSGDDCTQTSIGRGCLIDKRYVSHLGGWEEFAHRVWAEGRRLRFDEASELVIISDGAEWIRSLAKWLPTKCTLILDLFHVKHRIWEAAHALFGQSTKASAWAKRQCARVEDGRADDVIKTLEQDSRRAHRNRVASRPLPAFQQRLDGLPRLSQRRTARRQRRRRERQLSRHWRTAQLDRSSGTAPLSTLVYSPCSS